jgi:hypothetical protein
MNNDTTGFGSGGSHLLIVDLLLTDLRDHLPNDVGETTSLSPEKIWLSGGGQ